MKDLNSTPLQDRNISEFATRKIYIDQSLARLGWKKNTDWFDEYKLSGMPNASNVGYADYVLFGDDGRPLAVIEAKRTSIDIAAGRQQAKLYADLLENKFKRRPIIFLTNGYETHIWDDRNYQEREVSGIYSKRDLEKLFNLSSERSPILSDAIINDYISNRYYQKGAIKAVCNAFENKQRKALLVMATGSGKTRTVISLVDVMMRKGWIKNVLFLADRNSLVTQAKRAFTNLLPDLSITNMCENDRDPNARCVFSTYQTMINCIDTTCDSNGDLIFTCGHFDLIIVDEAHRSIYNRYHEIFDYFDSLLVGLTATPKSDIDKNTYDIFNLNKGEPTYGYELGQAVIDNYLVDYKSIETKVKFLEEGITYVDLSEEEREEYESLFIDEDGHIPEKIENTKINNWIFNKDTIIRVLDTVMNNGIKIDYNTKIGKTIIFAKNHKHAEVIYELFNAQYPNYPPGFCRVIDNYTNYSQKLIDEFSDNTKLPQIAISVDMLDTGIDIPEIVNLVFFKKVFSKSKFWQMVGRGTRLCPGLLDGEDKKEFYIFDFCSNFEFFRIKPKGVEAVSVMTLQERIFNLKVEMIYRLQGIAFQTEEMRAFRDQLIADVISKINELNKDNFAVKQHLRYVDQYSKPESFSGIAYNDTLVIANEIAHLILPYTGDIDAVRFDALMNSIELAYVHKSPRKKFFRELHTKVEVLSKLTTVPDIQDSIETIRKVLTPDYVETSDINEFENIRIELREIMRYLPLVAKRYCDTHFTDNLLGTEWNNSELDDDELVNYREKAEYYIRKHQDDDVIKKLKTNIPLNDEDVQRLEKILWSEIGTKEEYDASFGSKPLGAFVREITGLDMNAAKEAFSNYLNDSNLNERQLYFVNQIIEYIVQNGLITDYSVLMESPFTDLGSIADLFSDLNVWSGIKNVIDQINQNAEI